jgi:hypothetical protein
MVVGEINRRDGLDDIVVGVTSENGSKALVLEGPRGALRAKPEVFSLPAEATSLALGQLDDEYTYDLAIASGNDLVIIHGRDRKLSLDSNRQAEVLRAEINTRTFPFTIRSIAVGDFSDSYSADIALLSDEGVIQLLSESAIPDSADANVAINKWANSELARGNWSAASKLVKAQVSSVSNDSLVVADSETGQVQIIFSREGGQQSTGSEAASSSSDNQAVSIMVEADSSPVAVLPMTLCVNMDETTTLV